MQLAVYRLAWSALTRSGLLQVRAAFHFVRTGVTVAPADLLDEAGLIRLLDDAAPVG